MNIKKLTKLFVAFIFCASTCFSLLIGLSACNQDRKLQEQINAEKLRQVQVAIETYSGIEQAVLDPINAISVEDVSKKLTSFSESVLEPTEDEIKSESNWWDFYVEWFNEQKDVCLAYPREIDPEAIYSKLGPAIQDSTELRHLGQVSIVKRLLETVGIYSLDYVFKINVIAPREFWAVWHGPHVRFLGTNVDGSGVETTIVAFDSEYGTIFSSAYYLNENDWGYETFVDYEAFTLIGRYDNLPGIELTLDINLFSDPTNSHIGGTLVYNDFILGGMYFLNDFHNRLQQDIGYKLDGENNFILYKQFYGHPVIPKSNFDKLTTHVNFWVLSKLALVSSLEELNAANANASTRDFREIADTRVVQSATNELPVGVSIKNTSSGVVIEIDLNFALSSNMQS